MDEGIAEEIKPSSKIRKGIFINLS